MADRQRSFSLSIKGFAEQAPERVREIQRKVAGEALFKLVLRSPVGNPKLWKSKPPAGYVGGRFRANWNVGIGSANVTITQRIDKSGGATINRALAIINGSTGDADVYLTNSLPYSIDLEYGHSTQAPQGMVRLTTVEFQSFVNNAVRATEDKS